MVTLRFSFVQIDSLNGLTSVKLKVHCLHIQNMGIDEGAVLPVEELSGICESVYIFVMYTLYLVLVYCQ